MSVATLPLISTVRACMMYVCVDVQNYMPTYVPLSLCKPIQYTIAYYNVPTHAMDEFCKCMITTTYVCDRICLKVSLTHSCQY